VGLADARRTLPTPMHSANCSGGGVIMVRCSFSCLGLGPLVPVKGNINATVYNYILDDSVLPTLWQKFGKGPLLFQHDNAPVHKARSIQKRFVEISVEELDCPVQSPDLNLIDNSSNQLELRLRARLLWLNGIKFPSAMSSRKPSQKSGGCYSSKGGSTHY
jgi:hypothetical protein